MTDRGVTECRWCRAESVWVTVVVGPAEDRAAAMLDHIVSCHKDARDLLNRMTTVREP